MTPYPHPIIASEGWLFLAVAVAVALIVAYLWGWWSVPFWLVALFILQFFRDPPRNVPNDPEAVVSPADGRIVAVENASNPWLERDALKISVFMNVSRALQPQPGGWRGEEGLVLRRPFLMRRSTRLHWKTNAMRCGSVPIAARTSPACRWPG